MTSTERKNEAQELATKIIKDVTERILSGVLRKNILLHINSLGINGKLADSVISMAEKEAQNFSHYKIGKYGKELNYAKK